MSDTGRTRFETRDGPFEVDFCEPQLNLLAHAQAIELDIGSLCGGHGICGGDRIRTHLSAEERSKHLSPVTDLERRHLTEKQLNDGWRLACQCFPEKADQRLVFEGK